jgi:hypothetical protein
MQSNIKIGLSTVKLFHAYGQADMGGGILIPVYGHMGKIYFSRWAAGLSTHLEHFIEHSRNFGG